MTISLSRPDPEPSSSPTQATFRVTRRGFDPDEVRTYLGGLNAELERLREREHTLEGELVVARRPHVDFDELTDEVLTELVGEKNERILRAAKESASQARQHAEDEAVQIVAAAYDEATRVRESAQQDVRYLERTAVEKIESELASARGRGLEMVTEAREYRERVLADLAQRRDLAREQIRALIDGRDHLLRAFEVARLAAVDMIVELEQAAPTEASHSFDATDERAAAESAIYDAEDDITPVAGIEMPVSAGPFALEAVADESVAGEVVAGDDTTVAVVADTGPDTSNETRGGATAAPTGFEQRAHSLAPLVDSLVKQFKRVVVEEQNAVLTAIRRSDGVRKIAELLPDEDAHIERYHSCVLAEVDGAFAAGAKATGGDVPSDAVAMNAAVVGRLAEELVLPMRERLERVIESSDGNRFELSAFVRSAYREWKQRFDVLADELALLAYSYGAYAALPVGSLVVWKPDPAGSTCAELSANVGVVIRLPDAFPSGHQHPPTSPTCRCLIQHLPE